MQFKVLYIKRIKSSINSNITFDKKRASNIRDQIIKSKTYRIKYLNI